MDGSSTRAWQAQFARRRVKSFICNASPGENFILALSTFTHERFGALHSITSSPWHSITPRELSCCCKQGIFRITMSLISMSSNLSKARELERRHSNSSPVIRTEFRYRVVRLLKGPTSTVGWKAQNLSSRYRIDFLTPSDKSEHGKLYFSCSLRVSSSIPAVNATWSQLST